MQGFLAFAFALFSRGCDVSVVRAAGETNIFVCDVCPCLGGNCPQDSCPAEGTKYENVPRGCPTRACYILFGTTAATGSPYTRKACTVKTGDFAPSSPEIALYNPEPLPDDLPVTRQFACRRNQDNIGGLKESFTCYCFRAHCQSMTAWDGFRREVQKVLPQDHTYIIVDITGQKIPDYSATTTKPAKTLEPPFACGVCPCPDPSNCPDVPYQCPTGLMDNSKTCAKEVKDVESPYMTKDCMNVKPDSMLNFKTGDFQYACRRAADDNNGDIKNSITCYCFRSGCQDRYSFDAFQEKLNKSMPSDSNWVLIDNLGYKVVNPSEMTSPSPSTSPSTSTTPAPSIAPPSESTNIYGHGVGSVRGAACSVKWTFGTSPWISVVLTATLLVVGDKQRLLSSR